MARREAAPWSSQPEEESCSNCDGKGYILVLRDEDYSEAGDSEDFDKKICPVCRGRKKIKKAS